MDYNMMATVAGSLTVDWLQLRSYFIFVQFVDQSTPGCV